jgi:Ribbon-helix-helix protein, copG family
MSRYDILSTRSAAQEKAQGTEKAAVTRRGNPDYRQFSAYVPLDLYRALKVRLAEREFDLSEAVEEAIRNWLAQESESRNTSTKR